MSVASNRDRRWLLWFAAVVFVLVVISAIFAPRTDQSDTAPTTYSSAAHGALAAYLLLPELGYSVNRFEEDSAALDKLDAPHATLVLADPQQPMHDFRPDIAAIQRFLDRGGRVVATGDVGAAMLPQGRSAKSTHLYDDLCKTTGDGLEPLARLAPVNMAADVRWTPMDPTMHVEQRCGDDAVVVAAHYGPGEAVWWASADPLTNRGLRDSAALRLLLTSIGDTSRQVYFDEFYHGVKAGAALHLEGLPLFAISMQAAVLFLLILWSYSRRLGPTRPLARLPRTSPIEFAQSVGSLYQRAGATDAPILCARTRLLEFLQTQCGLPASVLRGTPKEIAEAVEARFGVNTSSLEYHLRQSGDAVYHRPKPKQALLLVRALHQHIVDLSATITGNRKSGDMG